MSFDGIRLMWFDWQESTAKTQLTTSDWRQSTGRAGVYRTHYSYHVASSFVCATPLHPEGEATNCKANMLMPRLHALLYQTGEVFLDLSWAQVIVQHKVLLPLASLTGGTPFHLQKKNWGQLYEYTKSRVLRLHREAQPGNLKNPFRICWCLARVPFMAATL